MFNRKLKKRVLELEKKLWAMENPCKYDLLQEIKIGNATYTITNKDVKYINRYKDVGYFDRILSVVIRWEDGSERVADINEDEFTLMVKDGEEE